MHDQDLAIVKALVSVAWADGVFAERERAMLDALLDAYGASAEDRAAIHSYAEHRRSLEDINVQDLSADDRRILLQHAVVLTFADGDQSPEELDLLTALASRLRIPEPEAKALLDAGAARAKKSLHLLG
jgi:uncharacterized tellurite resistance protein B-like protein